MNSKSIHIITQGKGGIGKSLIASLITQYIADRCPDQKIYALDLDPRSPTLSRFASLHAVSPTLFIDDEVDPDAMRITLSTIAQHDHAILDIGSSIFTECINYFNHINIEQIFSDLGYTIYFHIPIIATNIEDNIDVFVSISEHFSYVIPWLNYYRGDLVVNKITFQDMELYKKYVTSKTVIGTISLKKMVSDQLRLFERMSAQHQTFTDIEQAAGTDVILRAVVTRSRDMVYQQLDDVLSGYMFETKQASSTQPIVFSQHI